VAEAWYRKSLKISEALGNRPIIALTYCALGPLAETRKDHVAALDWTVRCIALFAEFPHPATGSGPHHLVRLTAALGLPALEASWQRCTGTPLPAHIRTAVEASSRVCKIACEALPTWSRRQRDFAHAVGLSD
jgi:hypothetical protein